MSLLGRKTRAFALLAAAFSAWAGAPVWAASPRAAAQSDEAVVIVLNARNPTSAIGLAEAKKLFLGQTLFWHGVVPVKVLTRTDSSPAAKAFFAQLGVTPQSFRKQWDELQLAGRGVAPKAVGSLQEAFNFVGQNPGGISFGLASEAWNLQLKAVKIVPVR